jgi:hypothetical protein
MNVLGARNPRELTLADERDPNFRKLQVHFKNRLIKTRTTGEKTKTIYAIVPGPIGRYTFQKEGSTTTIQALLLAWPWTWLTSVSIRIISGLRIISRSNTPALLEYVSRGGAHLFLLSSRRNFAKS